MSMKPKSLPQGMSTAETHLLSPHGLIDGWHALANTRRGCQIRMSNTNIRSYPARSNSKAKASSVSRRRHVTQPAVRIMSHKPLCYDLLNCHTSSTWLHQAPFSTRHTTARLAIPD
jgi:hypothetical protein